jgi:cytidine deaminase
MTAVSNELLIQRAIAVVNPRKVGEYEMGQVGCALVTDRGNIYVGVCIDVGSGIGFCAEHAAIAAMVTAGEYRIRKIVAVVGEESGFYFLSPCGRCREFIGQIHPDNFAETEVILGRDISATLSELLPYADWYRSAGQHDG